MWDLHNPHLPPYVYSKVKHGALYAPFSFQATWYMTWSSGKKENPATLSRDITFYKGHFRSILTLCPYFQTKPAFSDSWSKILMFSFFFHNFLMCCVPFAPLFQVCLRFCRCPDWFRLALFWICLRAIFEMTRQKEMACRSQILPNLLFIWDKVDVKTRVLSV